MFGDGISVGQAEGGLIGTGLLNIDGAATTVTIDSGDIGFILAGLSIDGVTSSTGTINVQNGATVNVTGRGGASGITLGRGGASMGTLNILGVDTTVNVIGAPGAVLVAGTLGEAVGDGTGILNVSDDGTLNIAGTTAGNGLLNIGLETGDGTVAVDDGGAINVDGTVNVAFTDGSIDTQTAALMLGATGSINAIDVAVGNRGTIDGTGTLSAQTLTIGSGGLAQLADLNNITSTIISGGTLDLSTPDQALSDQSWDINSGGTATVTGAFSVDSGSTLAVDDAQLNIGGEFALQGSASINQGGTVTVGGQFDIDAGGFLSGDMGSVIAPATVVGTGGSIGPGNSPGTLNFDGDLTLDGGDFIFEIAGPNLGEFDRINVDGTIDLVSGTVGVSLLNGFNPGGQSFDVLRATEVINVGADVDFLFNGPGPDFEFSIVNEGGFEFGRVTFIAFDVATLAGLDEQQQLTAGYLDTVCPNIELLGAQTAAQTDLDARCGSLRNGANTDAQIVTALDAINPDELIGTVNSALRFGNVQHGNLARRLNGLRNGANRVDLSNLNIQTDNASISGEDLQNVIEELANDRFERWGFFSDGRINFGDRDSSTEVPGYDFDTIALTVGTDYRITNNFYLGAALGYNEVNADFDVGGGLLMQSFSLSILGTYFKGDSFYADALVNYSRGDVETDRRVFYDDVSGPIRRKARGDTDSDQFSAGLGMGFDWAKNRWVFGPHAGVNYSDTVVDGFNETGADGLNLSIPDVESESFTANLGIHASLTLTPSWGVVVPYAQVDYVQEFETKDAPNRYVS